MDESKEWNLQFTPTNRYLALPSEVMERIFKMLPKSSQYEACLIHKAAWLPAARSALWEAPRFQSGLSAKQFVNAIRTSRRLGLLVRSLYLCVLTTQDAMFPIVNNSSLEIHHHQSTNTLSDPKLILLIIKSCEKITSLTIYGDRIETSHLEQIAATAIDLKSLSIIGSTTKDAPSISTSLLSRLESLVLDGHFTITDQWASQMSRATNLTTLQISLSGVEIPVLEKLCRNVPFITSLTLTDAVEFRDNDVYQVTKLFHRLKSFVLQGTIHVTEVALFFALSSCSELQRLKLRGSVNQHGAPAPSFNMYSPPPDHIIIYLRTLELENIMMDDKWFLLMASKLKQLQHVGLKSCLNLTEKSIAALLEHCHDLRRFYVRDCPQISSHVFAQYISTCPSLKRLSLEHSGLVTPSDIKRLCYDGKLHYFRTNGSLQVQNSVFGTKIKDNDIMELDEQSILEIAKDVRAKPTAVQQKGVHVLTHAHITQLAEQLRMPLSALEKLLNNITGKEEINTFDNNIALQEYDEYSALHNQDSNIEDDVEEDDDDDEDDEYDADTNNSGQTKSTDLSERSFVSRDWLSRYDENKRNRGIHDDYTDDEVSYNEEPVQKVNDDAPPLREWPVHDDQYSGFNDWPTQNNNNTSLDEYSQPQEFDNNAAPLQEWRIDNNINDSTLNDWKNNQENITNSPMEEWIPRNSDDSAVEEENHPTSTVQEWIPSQGDNIPTLQEWQAQNNHANNDKDNTSLEEFPLPGAQKPTSTKLNTNKAISPWENVPATIRSSHSKPASQSTYYATWNPNLAEDQVRQLTQTTMQNQQSRSKRVGHGRNQPIIADEGWGDKPQNYIAWSNAELHGYNKDVIEQQQKTNFWREDTQGWMILGKENADATYSREGAPPPPAAGNAKRMNRNRRRAGSYQSSADSFTEEQQQARSRSSNGAKSSPDSARNTKWQHDKFEGYDDRKPKKNDVIHDWNSFKKPSKYTPEEWQHFDNDDTRNYNNQQHQYGNSSTDDSQDPATNGDSFFSKNKKFPKGTRSARKSTRTNLSPEQMAGQWGNLFTNQTTSPEMDSKPQSPQQVEQPSVDVTKKFSISRLDGHHQPASSPPENNIKKWDNNQDIVDFTNLMKPEQQEEEEKEDRAIPNMAVANTTTTTTTTINKSNIITTKDNHFDDDWSSWLNHSNDNTDNNNNNNNNNIPDFKQLNNDPNSSPVMTNHTQSSFPPPPPTISPPPASSPSSPAVAAASSAQDIFTTKIRLQIDSGKPDTIYVNRHNIKEKVSALLDSYGISDEVRLEKMTADVTERYVKKETDHILNMGKKKKKAKAF